MTHTQGMEEMSVITSKWWAEGPLWWWSQVIRKLLGGAKFWILLHDLLLCKSLCPRHTFLCCLHLLDIGRKGHWIYILQRRRGHWLVTSEAAQQLLQFGACFCQTPYYSTIATSVADHRKMANVSNNMVYTKPSYHTVAQHFFFWLST